MKRRTRALLVVASLACALPALAEPRGLPPLKRGLGKAGFIDEYFGILYATNELRSTIDTSFLFAGQLGSGAVVEIGLRESNEVKDREAWLDETLKAWSNDGIDRKQMEKGLKTYAWVRFDQAEPDGTVIHHGYAFYPRGYQCFVVHAMLPRATPAASDIVTAALGRLRVTDRRNSFRLAHVIAKEKGSDPRLPLIISQAASAYMESGNAALAFQAAGQAERIALRQQKTGTLDQRTAWQIAFDGGTIFAAAGKHTQALTYLERCAELASGLRDGANAAAACRYQMSRSLTQLGRIDGAFRALASALFGTEDAKTIEFITRQALAEPDLAPLHADGRWSRLFSQRGG